MPTELLVQIAVLFGLVILGNAAIWWGISKRNVRLRDELARERTLFAQDDVRATFSAWSFLGGGVTWMRADVWVTDQRAVLFRRTPLGMAQPPIALFRSREEARANKRWMVMQVIVGDVVVREGEPEVLITSKGGIVRNRVKLRLEDPTAFRSALEAFLRRDARSG